VSATAHQQQATKKEEVSREGSVSLAQSREHNYQIFEHRHRRHRGHGLNNRPACLARDQPYRVDEDEAGKEMEMTLHYARVYHYVRDGTL
jgi:hypothetical protein